MNDKPTLEARRQQILDAMRDIRSLRRGSIASQYLKVPQKGQAQPALRGPYWTHTWKEGKKTVGRRVSAAEAEQLKQEVEAHHRFTALCKEFENLTERLGELERAEAQDVAVKKKRRKSPSRRTRK